VDARASFPLTRMFLGPKAPDAPSPEAFVKAVCDEHAKGDIPCRAARDLARFEAMLLELRPAPPGTPGSLPADDEPCVLAPHVRALMFGAALDEMLVALRAGKPAAPRPRRGWKLVWRDAGGKLHEHDFPREGGWMLEQFREPAKPGDVVTGSARPIFEDLWREGVIVRA
jgi:hypothetical protein